MPRTSRSVAQRLASQKTSKKRRLPRTSTPAPPPAPSGVSVDQILDEVVPSVGGSRAAATPTLAPASATRRSGTAAARSALAKPVPVRRRYAEYAAEYQYVWADLRRILLVAAVLTVLLIGLSFFIE